MIYRVLLIGCVCCVATASTRLLAQQRADVGYRPELPKPTFLEGRGPVVAVDAAHHNFHTAQGRYRPFAELLRRDGYRVRDSELSFAPENLAGIDVLVIVNALHERNTEDWSLPTPSAFTPAEVEAVRAWVHAGGRLLLIADHMPFPGAASKLAQSFGVKFSNGYARAGHWQPGKPQTFRADTGLNTACWITQGRQAGETVTQVATFGGSAFQLPQGATPILTFGEDSLSFETVRAPGITPEAPEVAIDGWHQGGMHHYGQGRVVVYGEAAMFSAQLAGSAKQPMGMNAPEAEQNHQLLLNTLHWLTADQL